jgi:hypothetical protein
MHVDCNAILCIFLRVFWHIYNPQSCLLISLVFVLSRFNIKLKNVYIDIYKHLLEKSAIECVFFFHWYWYLIYSYETAVWYWYSAVSDHVLTGVPILLSLVNASLYFEEIKHVFSRVSVLLFLSNGCSGTCGYETFVPC